MKGTSKEAAFRHLEMSRWTPARFIRSFLEGPNGGRRSHMTLTVGFLRDWFDACSPSDDAELVCGDGAEGGDLIGVHFQVVRAGQVSTVETYLKEDGSCYSNWRPIPNQNLQLPPTNQNFMHLIRESVTHPWTPADDEPEEPGWTMKPKETDTERKEGYPDQ